MRSLRTLGVRHALPALLLLVGVGAEGCAASGAAPGLNAMAGQSGANGGGSNDVAGSPGAGLAGTTNSNPLLPARIRRLTVAEYESSLRDLVGDAAKGITASFAPDALQGGGFSVNAAQIVDPVLIKQLAGAADTVAANVKMRLNELAPCADSGTQGEACAKTFIQSFVARAYRRPLEADELSHLLAVYHVAADATGYADGIAHLTRAALQSSSFLYQTEIGDGTAGPSVKLTPYELASTLSYLVAEKPASPALLADALAGKLDTPEGRAAAAADLALGPDGLRRLTRVVGEWLGTSRVAEIAKDSTVYDQFAGIKPKFVAENADFLSYLLSKGRGNVKELLGSTETYGDAQLAAFYESSVMNPDQSGKGVINVPNRVGVLNRGAFLAVFAHASETAPVLRGVALMRRVLCTDTGDPTKLKITVPAPVVDPSKTVRQRFAAHSSDAVCAACHKRIDAYGFAFEQFDGAGGRAKSAANSSTVIDFSTSFDGSYADSNALMAAIAKDETVRTCFARQLYRASAGTSDPAESPSEEAFIAYWQKDSAAAGGDIVGTLKDFVSSPAFALRRPQ